MATKKIKEDELTNQNDEPHSETSGVKWAWVVIFLVTCFATVMFDRENFTYALGHSSAAFVMGLTVSPIAYLILKNLLKIKWMWYHWFNTATSIGFILDILRWIVVPMAKGLSL